MLPQNNSDFKKGQSLGLSERNLIDYFDFIFKNRKIISYMVCTGLVLGIILNLLLPKKFIAAAKVLSPQEDSQGIVSMLLNRDDPLSALAENLIGDKTHGLRYVSILKSRSVADAMSKKFNLKELYGLEFIEDVRLELKNRSTIELSKNGQTIDISVRDRDPQRAADMANAYVEMLTKIKRKMNNAFGKRKRLFLENRLKEVRSDLEKAENILNSFQEKYHLVSIKEQAKVAIEGAAEIKGKIIAAQTELEVHKQFGTTKQIEAAMLESRIKELQKQLDSMEHGGREKTEADHLSGDGRNKTDFYIPFDDLPRLGMQLIRLTRETKIQEKLFELLSARYEIARIEEAKDVDPIQVLDKAIPPEVHSNKSMILYILLSVSVSLICAFIFIYLNESLHAFKINYPARYDALMSNLSKWRKNE